MSKMNEMKAELDLHQKMTASQILALAGIKSQKIDKYKETRNPQLYSTAKNVEDLIDATVTEKARERDMNTDLINEIIEVGRTKNAQSA